MHLSNLVRRLGATAIDLLLPQECAGCGAAGSQLCEACAAPLRAPPDLRWPRPSPPLLPPPYAVAAYDGAVRAAINAYKERGELGLVRPLGAALARAAAAGWRRAGAGGRPLTLVPVPTARATLRQRGHDAVGELARVAAARLRRTGVPTVRLAVLRPVRRLSDQTGLTGGERWVNLAGAFTVPPRFTPVLEGRSLIIVDDVITTGATIAEAARALQEGGAMPVAAAAVAATRRRHPDSGRL